MGLQYITKYLCHYCFITCEDYNDAENHCKEDEIPEIYVCEICGFETNDNTEAEMDCEYHFK
jgi:hypothetical protein